MDEQQNIIIYRTADGKASVALFAKDGKIWLNQQQMAELFATHLDSVSSKVLELKANYDKISQECDALKQAILRQVFE